MEGIYAHADLLKVYKAILDATTDIAHYLRYHTGKDPTSFSTSLQLSNWPHTTHLESSSMTLT